MIIKILVVDDHPMTVEGYINVLKSSNIDNVILNFEKAYDCESAYKSIVNAINIEKPFDLVILDYNLPSFEELKINTGGDLASYIRKNMYDSKIIMITAHTEILIVYEMLKKVHPEGLVIKKEVTAINLITIVKTVLNDNKYISPIVKTVIADIWKKEIMVEDFNRQILFYMSKGFRIKDIEDYIGLSTSAIQKRAILMKRVFDVNDNSSLIREAIKQGFI